MAKTDGMIGMMSPAKLNINNRVIPIQTTAVIFCAVLSCDVIIEACSYKTDDFAYIQIGKK